MFLCRRYVDSLHADTIMVLDIKLRGELELKYNLSEYGVVPEPSRKLKKCRVLLPARMIDTIQKYKYAYATWSFGLTINS